MYPIWKETSTMFADGMLLDIENPQDSTFIRIAKGKGIRYRYIRSMVNSYWLSFQEFKCSGASCLQGHQKTPNQAGSPGILAH